MRLAGRSAEKSEFTPPMHRLRNPALLGNLLLVLFALLLVLAVLNRADAVSDLPHHHHAHVGLKALPQ